VSQQRLGVQSMDFLDGADFESALGLQMNSKGDQAPMVLSFRARS
jgi:hypothetical protein